MGGSAHNPLLPAAFQRHPTLPRGRSACPPQILTTRPRAEWTADVQSRYKALAQFSKDDARLQFLRIIRSLPYGNSIFFAVRRIEDPIGLLPAKLIMGINKRGVHFFRPVPKVTRSLRPSLSDTLGHLGSGSPAGCTAIALTTKPKPLRVIPTLIVKVQLNWEGWLTYCSLTDQ